MIYMKKVALRHLIKQILNSIIKVHHKKTNNYDKQINQLISQSVHQYINANFFSRAGS